MEFVIARRFEEGVGFDAVGLAVGGRVVGLGVVRDLGVHSYHANCTILTFYFIEADG
mgnify:CR=1 FL=1